MSSIASTASNPLNLMAVCPQSVARISGIGINGPITPDWSLDDKAEVCNISFPMSTRYAVLSQSLYPSLMAFSLPTGKCVLAYVRKAWSGKRWLQLEETDDFDAEWQEGTGTLNVPLPSPKGLFRMNYVEETVGGWFQVPPLYEQYLQVVNHGEYAQIFPARPDLRMYELIPEWLDRVYVYLVLQGKDVVVGVRGQYGEHSCWEVLDQSKDPVLWQALVAAAQRQGWFLDK